MLCVHNILSFLDMKKYFYLIAIVLLGSCDGSTDKELNNYTDDFDRSQFLTNLYDNSIIPSFFKLSKSIR